MLSLCIKFDQNRINSPGKVAFPINYCEQTTTDDGGHTMAKLSTVANKVVELSSGNEMLNS